jgi:hypothetical protein
MCMRTRLHERVACLDVHECSVEEDFPLIRIRQRRRWRELYAIGACLTTCTMPEGRGRNVHPMPDGPSHLQ